MINLHTLDEYAVCSMRSFFKKHVFLRSLCIVLRQKITHCEGKDHSNGNKIEFNFVD